MSNTQPKRTLRARLLTGAGLAALALGVATSGSVATAEPAEAATRSNWSCYYKGGGFGWICRSYVNYNWWEETFLGKKDGYTGKQSPYNVSGSPNRG